MNLHWFELFYYVAQCGGISRAVAQMPYGIQQPAISEQMRLLEEDLGGPLFERQPFRLTAEGQELFAALKPFFVELDALVPHLRDRGHPHLRLSAAGMITTDHLPRVIGCMEALQPGIRFTLSTGSSEQMLGWLRGGQADLVITALGRQSHAGLAHRVLLTLPLVLLVPKSSPLRSAETLWTQPEIEEPLICPSLDEGVGHAFQKGLRQGGLRWMPRIVAHSVSAVAGLVAEERGIGVSVALPALERHPRLRVLPLPGFEPVAISALWQRADTPKLQSLLEVLQAQARLFWTGPTLARTKR